MTETNRKYLAACRAQAAKLNKEYKQKVLREKKENASK
jgi:hypothetical protein